MSSISSTEPPEHPIEWSERAPRTNLLLSATIEAGSLKTPVRIRNLSESGALLEGAAFPNIGDTLTLRRLDMEIGATVVWRREARCGVRFEGKATVADWKLGTWTGTDSNQGQSRVDAIQAAVRSGSPAAPTNRATVVPDGIERHLDDRISEELAQLRRLLESMGDELTNEPILVQRHPKTLQSFDLACQTLGHLAAIINAKDRSAAVDAIGMEELRARLLRKPISKSSG